MYSLAYISVATKLYHDEELDQILAWSRGYNPTVGITGLLLYKKGTFMQFLEGPKEAVLALLQNIRCDRRHHSMIVIYRNENQLEQEFESWSMGFQRLRPDKHIAPSGFTDLWELPFSHEDFLINPTRSVQFLLCFKKTAHLENL